MEGMDEIRAEVRELRAMVIAANTKLAEIDALLRTEAERCPYRETVARTSNGLEVLSDVVSRIRALEIKMAGIGALIGLVTGALSSLITNSLIS